MNILRQTSRDYNQNIHIIGIDTEKLKSGDDKHRINRINHMMKNMFVKNYIQNKNNAVESIQGHFLTQGNTTITDT